MSVGEAVEALVSELPKAVQDFITGPKKDAVALELAQKYGLHADQAGEFQHSYLLMLLGVLSPEEFASRLRKEGVPESSIQGLAADINQKVFIPIREQERLNRDNLNPAVNPRPVAPAQPQWVQVSAPPPPQRPLTPPAPLAQTPIYTPPTPAPSVSAFNQPASAPNTFIPQAPANVVLPGAPAIPPPAPVPLKPQPNFQPQPVQRMENPVPQAQAPRPEPVVPQAAQQEPPPQMARPIPPTPAPVRMPGEETIAMVRTMGTDMEAMRRGEQPAPHIMAIPQSAPSSQPQWAPSAPQPQPQPAQWATPPSPVPTPQMPVSAPQPKPQYTRPYIPPTPRVAARPVPPVPGSSDPYREPIE